MKKQHLTIPQIAAIPGMASARTLRRRAAQFEIPGATSITTPHGHRIHIIPNTPEAMEACKHRPRGNPKFGHDSATKPLNPTK